jgi:hypothetical protein
MRFKFALPVRQIDENTIEIIEDSRDGRPLINIELHPTIAKALSCSDHEKMYSDAMTFAIRNTMVAVSENEVSRTNGL